MLLSQNLLDSLVDANSTHRKIAGYLFKYDKRQQRLCLSENKWARHGFLARWCLLFSLAGVLVCCVLGAAYATANTDTNVATEGPGSALRVLMVAASITCGERYRLRGMYPTEYTEFVNALIQLELKYATGVGVEPSIIAVLARVTCKMTHYLGKWMFPITMGIVSVLKPELPTNVVSIFGWDLGTNLDGIMITVLVFGTNAYVWGLFSVQGYCLVADISVGALGLTFSQHVMLRRFQRLLNGKSWDTIGNENPLYEIVGFRSLQITVKLFNQCMQSVLFMFMLGNGVGQMVGVALQLGNTTEMPIRILGGACILQSTLCILIIYGFAGNFHDESLKSVQKLHRSVKDCRGSGCMQQWRLVDKFLASCPPSRISFGFSNFIERRTPLVFQMFCLNRIVDLLLLRK